MAETETKRTERQEAEQSAVVWLTVYEAAKQIGNTALTERARRELEARGVFVRPAGVAP